MSLRLPWPSPTFLISRAIFLQTAPFHTTSAWSAEVANHYETLGLDQSASAGDIKKQFYSLSKTHHPDHNPDDPEASSRFVKISEAYAVLGVPQERERYDRDTQKAQEEARPYTRQGTHSSASTPFGSRPPRGLSRRRTQFKGPPPSFYRSGGWGAHGKKRQAEADGTGSASTGEPKGGVFGFGQGQAGWGNDVPHFDREGHHRTHQQQDLRRHRRLQAKSLKGYDGGSVLLKFVVVTAIVGLAFSIPTMFENVGRRTNKKDPTS